MSYVSCVQKMIMVKARIWVIWGLVVFASFRAAELTWAVYQPGVQSSPALAAGALPAADEGDSLDLDRLQRAALFGAPEREAVKPVAEKAKPQVKSRLAVTLLGIVKGEGADSSVAILAERNQQRAYGVGDRLVTESSATLIEILADRVVLEVAGQHQYIELQANGANSPSSAPARAGIQPRQVAPGTLPERVSFNDSSIRGVIGDVRQKIISDPLSFGRFIQLRPHAESGRLTGYQLHPGRDGRLFRQLGLRAGDRVTHVDGLDVTEPENIPRLMELVQSQSRIRVGITRGETSQDIDVEL